MSRQPVAYFCAEFGLQSDLPWYAGGLGILAGDTLKQAADEAFPMVGVGLLYRGESSQQHITPEGLQEEYDSFFDPVSVGLEHVYVDGMPLFVKVHLTELDIWLRCWKKTLHNGVVLYLLDTDTDQNQHSERSITHELYAGTEESLVKQQLILGIGGVKLLHALEIHPSVYHVQEGRPAFLHWQLIRSYMDEHGLSFEAAHDQAKQKTVYTNHTLVAAGNQSYDTSLLKRYARYYADKMGVSVEALLEPGMEGPEQGFNMTRFALNTSCRASGVSQGHTKLSQEQWPQYSWCNVTNGVHFPTWQSPEIIAKAGDAAALWQAHKAEKQRLMEFVRSKTGYGYNPDHLVITWARRLAGYKRYEVLFNDVTRLAKILKSSDRPVQLLVSGKAHRMDVAGKQSLQKMIQAMQQELSGQALFIPDYSIEIAQHLVRGSDVWLNIPEKGKEACGTSGMKAASNGVLQCTVADGWTAEVSWQDVGWELDTDQIPEQVYQTLETAIVPAFYTRSPQDIPVAWTQKMQKTIELSQHYSASRMLREYAEKMYFLS